MNAPDWLSFPLCRKKRERGAGGALGAVDLPNPLQMRVSEARRLKIRQKSVFHPQKPKKTVEITHFPIDFVPAQAAW
jgi:hypothetical protein